MKATGLAQEDAEVEFKQAALASWQEFQRTGMHATLGEVAAWMRSWGMDEELPMPCRLEKRPPAQRGRNRAARGGR